MKLNIPCGLTIRRPVTENNTFEGAHLYRKGIRERISYSLFKRVAETSRFRLIPWERETELPNRGS